MIEHWYDYLPAAWYTEGHWYVLISVILIFLLVIVANCVITRNTNLQPSAKSFYLKISIQKQTRIEVLTSSVIRERN